MYINVLITDINQIYTYIKKHINVYVCVHMLTVFVYICSSFHLEFYLIYFIVLASIIYVGKSYFSFIIVPLNVICLFFSFLRLFLILFFASVTLMYIHFILFDSSYLVCNIFWMWLDWFFSISQNFQPLSLLNPISLYSFSAAIINNSTINH